MNRRKFLRNSAGTALVTAAGPLLNLDSIPRAATSRFKYAICNEMFEKWDFSRQVKAIKAAGFQGIEIAPFTLADSVDEISPVRRREMRDIMKSEGIAFAGLHWLLVSPKGLHVTTADRQLREKSWAYLKKLVDFCADMGDGGIMVFGSPKQRASEGNTAAEATALLRDGFKAMAPHVGSRGVTLLIEALPSKDTNVVNTVDQAFSMVKEINHPAIQTMFDFHNTPDEKVPFEHLVQKYFPHIRHIHVNEMDGRYPGTGTLDYRPVFQKLADLKYSRWVSLEVFDFKPSPEHILRETRAFYNNLEKKLKA